MHTGWFPIDRELLSSDLWLSEKFTRGQAWVDLVGLARFKAGFVRLRGKRVDLQRGQLAWSQRELARRWRWSDKTVRQWLKELKRDGRITYQNVGVTTVITVLYYDDAFPGAALDTAPRTAVAPHSVPTKEQGKQCQQRQPPLGEWGEIQSALKELGIVAAVNVIDAAQTHRLAPADVRQWIDEYRDKPGAWGPGALAARLTGKLSDWPPPADEYLRGQARAEAARSTARQAAARVERREALARQRQREEELERKFGPALDALSDTDRSALEFHAIPDAAERGLSRRLPTAHRARLLAALAQQHVAQETDAA